MVALSKKFVPVLIDKDTHADIARKYHVTGIPAVKFMKSNGDVVSGFVGAIPTAKVVATTEQALKEVGPIRYTKHYIKMVKADQKLTKAMKYEKYADAIKAIVAIEKIRHEGPELQNATKIRIDIEAIATERFDEAEELSGTSPKKAAILFKKIRKEFKGLTIADKAKKRAKQLKE